MEESKSNELRYTTCGHCGNMSEMNSLGTVDDVTEVTDENLPYRYGTSYQCLKCPSCAQVVVVEYTWHNDFDYDGITGKDVLHPIDPTVPQGLPEEIHKSYLLAEDVRKKDVNAYAVMIGRLLEMVCLDQGARKGKLSAMLNRLAKDGVLPKKLAKVALGVNGLRNVGAHATGGSLGPKEGKTLQTLTSAVLGYVYSLPYLASLAEKHMKDVKDIELKG